MACFTAAAFRGETIGSFFPEAAAVGLPSSAPPFSLFFFMRMWALDNLSPRRRETVTTYPGAGRSRGLRPEAEHVTVGREHLSIEGAQR